MAFYPWGGERQINRVPSQVKMYQCCTVWKYVNIAVFYRKLLPIRTLTFCFLQYHSKKSRFIPTWRLESHLSPPGGVEYQFPVSQRGRAYITREPAWKANRWEKIRPCVDSAQTTTNSHGCVAWMRSDTFILPDVHYPTTRQGSEFPQNKIGSLFSFSSQKNKNKMPLAATDKHWLIRRLFVS